MTCIYCSKETEETKYRTSQGHKAIEITCKNEKCGYKAARLEKGHES